MIRCFLALGTNIPPKKAHLRCALKALRQHGSVVCIAPVYQSPPYGFTKQETFYNTALVFDTALSALQLLKNIKTIETECGRQERFRWGPREVDIDIILFGNHQVVRPEIVVPHPDFHNRRFVLQPLCDLEPDRIPPGFRNSLAELLQICPDPSKLKEVQKHWWDDAAQD